MKKKKLSPKEFKNMSDEELKEALKKMSPYWTDYVGVHGEHTHQVLAQVFLLAELEERGILERVVNELKEEIA